MIISNGELVLFPETQPQPLTNKRLTNLVSSGSSLLFLRLHWLVHFALPRIYPDRSIDFDNPKVYGDTSITDGLV